MTRAARRRAKLQSGFISDGVGRGVVVAGGGGAHLLDGAAGGLGLGRLDGAALAAHGLFVPADFDVEDAVVRRPLGLDEVVDGRDVALGLKTLLEQRLGVEGGGPLGAGQLDLLFERAQDEGAAASARGQDRRPRAPPRTRREDARACAVPPVSPRRRPTLRLLAHPHAARERASVCVSPAVLHSGRARPSVTSGVGVEERVGDDEASTESPDEPIALVVQLGGAPPRPAPVLVRQERCVRRAPAANVLEA